MSQVPVTNVPVEGVALHYQQRSESSTPLTSTSPVNPGDPGALYTRLRNQVEFYFSPQNLARDTYLRNMLTAQHQEVPSPPPLELVTPVAVITNFPKVRDICAAFGAALSDPPHVLLARACEGSTIVTVSADGAWIGPSSQQLPPLTAPTPRMVHPTPQAHFQQGSFPPSPHQTMMMPAAPMGEVQPMHFMGPPPVPVVQNVPLSRGSASPSSNSLDSMPSQAKETVVVVPDMPAECNPILLMTAFTTGSIRPSAVSADGNTNTWYITFTSEADANAAISASSEKTIAGAPIRAKLKAEAASARVSVASASGASLSSMSASQRQQMQVPQMVQQPVSMPGAPVMYPPGAYPMPQPPPPQMQHGMSPYPMGGYNMAPMAMPGQPFPSYPQMQPMYPYGYMPQHGHPHFMMNHPPMMGRFGPGVPPPPPRYPGPPYPYQHGPQHHMGDGPGQFHRQHQQPPRHHAGEESGPGNNFNEGGQRKDGGGKKKKNKYQKQHSSGSLEGGGNQQPGSNHISRENTSSPNNFGRGRGRHGDNFRRSTGSASPALNRHQRGNSNKFSKSDNQSSADKQNENREIFTATDFPGLSGDGKAQNTQHGDPSDMNKTKIFSGYADALKKKDAELKGDKESHATKETDVSDIDSITRQTEAMEREILSDFHDLTIPGDDDDNDLDNNRNGDKDIGKTMQQAKPFEHLPILPGMSSLGQSLSIDEPNSGTALHHSSNYTEEEEANVQQTENDKPVIDATDISPAATHSQTVEEAKPATTGAWGTKRLFADVIKDK